VQGAEIGIILTVWSGRFRICLHFCERSDDAKHSTTSFCSMGGGGRGIHLGFKAGKNSNVLGIDDND
jgi:hypothetical protein